MTEAPRSARPASPLPALFEAGRVVDGRYVLAEVIGRGASSVVFRADDLRLRRPVALKALTAAGDLDREAFEAEVAALARLSHPNVVACYDAGDAGGVPYLVMEFVDGRSLATLGGERGLERVEDGVAWALEAAAGLAHIHATGLLHRDLKPQNILVTREGRAKIVDLGLAAAPGAPPPAGTPAYLAPEVAAGGPATVRSDLYALGVVLYRLFAGVLPGRPPAQLDTVRPEVPSTVATTVARLIEVDPSRRYATAAEALEALRT